MTGTRAGHAFDAPTVVEGMSHGPIESVPFNADFDVELAQAENIRWMALNSGAVPLTAGEIAGKHVKNFAKDTGIALLVCVAMAGIWVCCRGYTAPCMPVQPGLWATLCATQPGASR